ncbi:MAG: phosphopyruvate hydratase [Deltaproteobacteria bacterium]|nr:phosphopyruvate hydratase [Deltaproteobacteria bacterium]
MASLKKIISREILDSRGNPTIETDIILDTGHVGRAAVPSGASTGSDEALELRDKNKRYCGKGVHKAVSYVNNIIAPELLGKDVSKLFEIDQKILSLDGTPNKSKLGANAILSVSMAVMKAYSVFKGEPLFRIIGRDKAKIMPVPLMNILNGGAHADNNLAIQEFMIMPLKFMTFSDALRAGVEVFHALKKKLKEKGHNTAVGDEGGFAPNLKSHSEALDFIMSAIEEAGYKPQEEICIALDVAANELYKGNHYEFEGKELESSDLISYYEEICGTYPIVSIEDGLAEKDFDGWKHLTQKLGNKVQIVGDDLYVTNPKKLEKGIEEKWSNSILIKLNQIGSVSETLQTIAAAQKANFSTIISHRSGETEDTFIADLAVGTNAGQIKTGSACRSERMAKYNQLLRIEEFLGQNAIFPGKDIFYNLR